MVQYKRLGVPKTCSCLLLFSSLAIASACDDNNNPVTDAAVHLDSATTGTDGPAGVDTAGVADTAPGSDSASGLDAADAAASVDAAEDGAASDAADGPPAATWTDVYTMVITARCAPCHTTSDGIGVATGKLDMTSQATAYQNLFNVAAAGSSCSGKGTRVVPGMPDSSIFYLKVSLDDPTPCGSKMPLGGPALEQAQADMIESWITAGAQNN